ncbi:serine/threonine protein phosphatase [Croceicoccus naphthovorans]|uniref:Serine/threonine protein phosphatase n=1 Tax=Croceicoccus naphthovorans TaxID=1348774 RepID=A0A0G3XJW8_9SPHN|nr:serine/threonine protein phosphatase [Croceicoccus naphthovorans]
MLKSLSNLFGLGSPVDGASAVGPALPDGKRVYAIGDIHGRLDLFTQMIERIELDDAARGDAETLVILLGDLVDRGPESAGVIRAARDWQARRPVRILMGNHEEMFLRALEDEGALRHFLRVGGKETVLSFGLERDDYRGLSMEELHDRLVTLIPQDDIAFVAGMEDMVRLGDYVFVHAGVDPALPLDSQRRGDVRWIREPFLSHPQTMDVCVVHGHTIREQIDIHAPGRGKSRWPNRIGIDTGAFRTGRLTAIGLQGTDRWFMEAS